MFHEITYTEEKRRRIAIVAACAAALRESILNAAKQCAAIEGSYPSDLQHLEDDYGLTINHDDYIITYECFADNIVPSVAVAPR